MASPFGSPRRSRLSAVRYWGRVFIVPILCLAFAIVAFQQADATNNAQDDRPRVEIVAPRTPVLSARRLPNLLALPSQAVALQPTVLDALNGVPPDTTCATVTNSRGIRVFEHNPALLLSPASNQKVLLAYGLLNQFQPERTFGTYLATNAQLLNNAVQGNVWLIGTGDPVLTTEPYAKSFIEQPQVHSSFESLADQLKANGITAIRGDIVADASRYDTVKSNPAWPGDYVLDGTVGPISALSVNRGFLTFPPAGQEYSGSGARTVSADPARDAANLLITLLRERGITVDGKAEVGTVPQTPTFLAQLESPPLRDIIGQMLRTSDNTIAEMLFKELGVARANKGSFDGGVAALSAILSEKGMMDTGAVIADGSGLATANQVTCSMLNAVLAAAGRHSDLVDHLAVGGENGTLKGRMVGTAAAGAVWAKTGSLDAVSSLSGYVDSDKGDTVSFAVIVNGPDAERFKPLEDRLAVALTQYPGGPPVGELGPLAG